MSDDKLQDAINYGDQAKLLVGHEPFKKGISDLDAELMAMWRRCSDSAERDKIWQLVNLLGKFEHILSMTIQNGRIAREDLNSLIKERS